MLFESGVILPDDVVVDNNNRRAMFVRESLQLGLGHFLNCCPGFRLFASSVQVKNGTIFRVRGSTSVQSRLNNDRFPFASKVSANKFSPMKMRAFLGFICTLLLSAGCRSAYYSTMETFGVYKRDLLKKSVIAARDDQKAASEQFKDALTHLRELYNFQGGDLEKAYSSINREYERSTARANTVHKRVKDVETVSADLFKEWEKEIKQISSPKLRESSSDKLRETRRRYDEMHAALKKAEQSMDPVLARFHDQVLYLKHNLNAAAIASLKGESTDIQNEISKLLQDMNTAITHADTFINSMP